MDDERGSRRSHPRGGADVPGNAGLDPGPYIGAYLRGASVGRTVCHYERGRGAVRKKKPHDCGRPRCGVCHPHKRFSKGTARALHVRRALMWEMRAKGGATPAANRTRTR